MWSICINQFLLVLAELECLFWGLYYSSHIGSSSPKKELHLVTQKWSQTLQQLDIANQLFTEEDLQIAMSYLAQAKEVDTLRSLNLSGTRITPSVLRYSQYWFPPGFTLLLQSACLLLSLFYLLLLLLFRSVIGQITTLNYLNLSSCRYLPRGVKRIYRGQEDIKQLLDKLE